MTQLFTDEMRRNPYTVYEQIRAISPLLHDPQSGLWMIFDYDGVKRVLGDLDNFSSKNGPDWLSFSDPPRHTKLRALISKAFTPRSIMNLEPRIKAVVHELLDKATNSSAATAVPDEANTADTACSAGAAGVQQIDVATEFAVPLPITVIAEMFGVPSADRERFKRWSDVLLKMSYTIGRKDDEAAAAIHDFKAMTAEMNAYLAEQLAARRTSASSPPGRDDLLTRLLDAEVDGQRLSHDEMLGFFQLFLLAGETTTNLINNAILCFIEYPDQLARLRSAPELLPSAIEEVLRFRSPLQWIYRLARRDVELHGQVVPAGRLVLTMVGAANRDPAHFPEANCFDISRDPNPHIAFGHGPHFCLGAALARLEARIALAEFLARVDDFELASDEPWAPRKGLFVLGPTSLPIRIRLATPSVEAASSRQKAAAV